MRKQKVPSQRLARLARKILESAEMRPAAMVKGYRAWTIQWNELRNLARFVDSAGKPSGHQDRRKPAGL